MFQWKTWYRRTTSTVTWSALSTSRLSGSSCRRPKRAVVEPRLIRSCSLNCNWSCSSRICVQIEFLSIARLVLALVFTNWLFYTFTIQIKPLHPDSSGGLGALGRLLWISVLISTSVKGCLSGKSIDRFKDTGGPDEAGMKHACLLCCIRSFPQHKQKLIVEQLVKASSDCACSHLREREQNCYLGSGLYVKVFFNRLGGF